MKALLITILSVVSAHASIYDYFPFEKGLTWSYSVNKERIYQLPNGTQTQSIQGTSIESMMASDLPELSDNSDVLVIQQKISEKNLTTGQESDAELMSYMTFEGGVLTMLAQIPVGAPGLESSLTKFSPPVTLIDLKSVQSDTSCSMQLSMQGMETSNTFSDFSYEPVEISSKVYEKALKISGTGIVTGTIKIPQEVSISDGSVEETLWLVEGIGIVKQVQELSLSINVGNSMVIKSIDKKVKLLEKFTDK
jgi:hypothetical protein